MPSVGLSQIIDVDDNFNKKWKDNLLLTSLKGSSIFRLSMSEDYSKIISGVNLLRLSNNPVKLNPEVIKKIILN